MSARRRPRIAFLDYPDVFEDFYSHYGVSHEQFATNWDNTGNHRFLRLIQKEIGDISWYEFSLRPELREARHERTGCRVRMVRSPFAHRWLWAGYYRTSLCWKFPSLYRPYGEVASGLASLSADFLSALRRDPPDAFFVQDYASRRFDLAVVLGRLMRAPVIAWHAGSRPEAYFGKRVRRVTLPRADCLIASSRGEAEMLQERFRVSPGKLRIILTPIDLTEYKMESREASARALGLPAGRRYALFVGRFDDAVKRIGWMVRAVERLSVRYPELTLLLVGDGADRPRLEVEARKLDPGRVLFRGWERDAARKALYYNSAEVLLIPSLREGFPTVVGEAMACGTPVVGSSVGGIPEMVINGQTGFLHAPSDEAGFGQALGGLLENKALAERMRAICRSMAEARLAEDVVGLQLKECFVAAGVRNVE